MTAQQGPRVQVATTTTVKATTAGALTAATLRAVLGREVPDTATVKVTRTGGQMDPEGWQVEASWTGLPVTPTHRPGVTR